MPSSNIISIQSLLRTSSKKKDNYFFSLFKRKNYKLSIHRWLAVLYKFPSTCSHIYVYACEHFTIHLWKKYLGCNVLLYFIPKVLIYTMTFLQLCNINGLPAFNWSNFRHMLFRCLLESTIHDKGSNVLHLGADGKLSQDLHMETTARQFYWIPETNIFKSSNELPQINTSSTMTVMPPILIRWPTTL
jgi:hypothetical protein